MFAIKCAQGLFFFYAQRVVDHLTFTVHLNLIVKVKDPQSVSDPPMIVGVVCVKLQHWGSSSVMWLWCANSRWLALCPTLSAAGPHVTSVCFCGCTAAHRRRERAGVRATLRLSFAVCARLPLGWPWAARVTLRPDTYRGCHAPAFSPCVNSVAGRSVGARIYVYPFGLVSLPVLSLPMTWGGTVERTRCQVSRTERVEMKAFQKRKAKGEGALASWISVCYWWSRSTLTDTSVDILLIPNLSRSSFCNWVVHFLDKCYISFPRPSVWAERLQDILDMLLVPPQWICIHFFFSFTKKYNDVTDACVYVFIPTAFLLCSIWTYISLVLVFRVQTSISARRK